jgi:N4-(beta-N-acetylglucosaminyl)-L-asparaginase
MDLSRRSFLYSSAGAVVANSLSALAAPAGDPAPEARPLIVSTWPFGKPANEKAREILAAGGSALDAVEMGIRLTESDPNNTSVGYGGIPNAAGVVQLDACIMVGHGHKAGSVAALEGIKHPISAARRVLEKTPHVMLVGEGARLFAQSEGLETIKVPPSTDQHVEWFLNRSKQAQVPAPNPSHPDNHDTIALLVLTADGRLAGGCSTSGWGRKMPGRVGDSPIIGSGLYVDEDVGAAGATGLGENVMRYCGSFLVVELMRSGMHPREACLETVRRIAAKEPAGSDPSINFIAIDKQGRFGAAGSASGFQYSVTSGESSRVLTGDQLSERQIGPEGGNRK